MLTSVRPSNGTTAGGSQVTLIGVALGSGNDVTTVMFGDRLAIILSQSNDSVVVLTPAAAAGTVNVSVQSSSQGSSTLPNGFTYVQRMSLLNLLLKCR